ncbi:MAG TPA: polysaccharide deacetylase family protein [Candidatus Aquicultor sp.]|jgi:chitin deacetylase
MIGPIVHLGRAASIDRALFLSLIPILTASVAVGGLGLYVKRKNFRFKSIVTYAALGISLLGIAFVTQNVIYYKYCCNPESELFGHVYYDAHPKQPEIALTYDDGPSKYKTTLRLLDLLNKNHAKATFFMIGKQADSYPSEAQEVYKQGFEVGNHTFDHAQLAVLRYATIKQEIEKTDGVFAKLGIKTNGLIRPPYGLHFIPLAIYASRHDRKIITWSLASNDWKLNDPQKIADRVISNARPGSIVLMHDTTFDFSKKRSPTLGATAIILKTLSKKGYKFVTVSQLLNDSEVKR